ncbi:hypothetical protein HCN44_008722 [Aphidius gifuensis]|uniref:Sorting nexin-14 n=1 Tax=Aphidius gifuensis TaxID=684658 RepID=A0A835CQC6_APHGI|nr:sorting nexin-14-like [Aphidius gifuensis]KAF7990048.1 hypothetical protein HCN44_008722 [Aphidius gifuensis]
MMMTFKNKHIALIIILLFGLLLAIFDSIIWCAIICSLFIIGDIWGIKIIKLIDDWIKNNVNKNIDKPEDNNKKCKVCNEHSCNRHRPSGYFGDVKVPKDFDYALKNLLEKLLDTYVCTWYSYISTEKIFVHHLKQIIATTIIKIITRLLSVDISKIIFNNLIPVALEHAKDWKLMVEKSKLKGGKPEDYVIDCIGNKIHPAAYSRQSEIDYLRKLVTALLPFVLSSTYISTNNKVILREILANWVLLPAIDALADPNNINFLIELCTQYEGTLSNEIDAISVPVLDSWMSPVATNKSSDTTLKPSLDEILNNPQLLYLFMRHIKDKGPVNLLQFCLDIDDLSKRMLNPEMTPEIEEILFTDASNIYSTYLKPDGLEYLDLPDHICDGMKKILDGGVNKIQELRTSRPLYQAHQEAHGLLEKLCLSSFHNSYELYEYICGSTMPINSTTSSSQSSTSSSGVGARLGNQLGKIRGVLRSTAVDGSIFETENVYQAEEVDCTPRTYNDANLNDNDDKANRDLTTWRITIPHVDTSDVCPLYIISIDNTANNKSWTVLRCDNDFYNLRGRLIEFHGDKELNDSILPSRKNQNLSLTTNRQIYQDFIQNLLCKLTLKNSELLYIFLTVTNVKPYLTNYSTDIGVLYQSVAHKLRKEKGQNLDKFMNTFLSSVINVKYEQHTDVGVDLTNDEQLNDFTKIKEKKFLQEPFGNNLNINHQIEITNSFDKQQVRGACFCIAEAVESLMDVPESASRIIWLVACLNRSRFDSFLNKYLDDTLVKLLSGGRAAIVIELLQKAIFNENNSSEPQSVYIKDEKCYRNAKQGLYSLLPWWTFGLLDNYWRKLMISLFEPLQSPTLNKHLAYVLVDQVVAKIFPELLQNN